MNTARTATQLLNASRERGTTQTHKRRKAENNKYDEQSER